MKNISTLVLSGGGTKGISHCGVLKYLEEKELHKNLKTICGVSIGSIVGLMYVLKYTAKNIEEEIMSKNFKTLKNIQIVNIFTKYGIDSGEHLMLWVESQLIKRGLPLNITFKQLYEWNPIVLKIGVTNLTKHKFEIFDKFSKPDIPVIKAIRISISIPVLFECCKLDDCIYVDGGVLNNYPIRYFDNEQDVLGVEILSSDAGNKHVIESFDNFIVNVMQCVLNKNIYKNSLHFSRTIEINTNDSIISFDITKHNKRRLIEIGYKSTEKYFAKNKDVI